MGRKFTYDAVITKEEDGYVVNFPQIPGAYTEGDTREKALENTSEVLSLVMAGYVEEGTQAPKYERVAEVVAVSVDITDELIDETHYMTQSDAAELLGVTVSRVSALIRSGQLETKWFEGRREVSIASVNAYAESPRKSGRPAKRHDGSDALA